MTENNSSIDKLVSILEAANELEAITIQSFLESQHIDAAIRSRQIPMYDGIAKAWNPVWGYVMVMEKDRERAEQLIAEYLDSCKNSDESEDVEYSEEGVDS